MTGALRDSKTAVGKDLNAQATMRKERSLLKDMDLSLKAKGVSPKQKRIRTDPKKAFLLAAENRRLDVLRHFLEHEQYKDKVLADVESLKVTLRETEAEMSATAHASKAPNGSIPEEEDPGLKTFEYILGKVQLTEDNYTEIWTEAVTKSSEKVIRHLLAKMRTKFSTVERAKIIVEKGTANMWNLYGESMGDELEKIVAEGHLLHTAVESHKADIVEAILRQFQKRVGIIT
ncbi:hypothetical protein VTG60DRAFT_5411 [Thermothelomyces hinnuleus]